MTETGDPRFHKLAEEMVQLHDRKQSDYGNPADPFANITASREFGVEPWIGGLIRLNDKVTRLKAFARKGSLANESVEDSLMDIAVYALASLVLYREEEGESDGSSVQEVRGNGVPLRRYGLPGGGPRI